MGSVDELGVRGAALWKALGEKVGSPAGELALEACRMADRLDGLDEAIRFQGVVELMRFRTMLGSGGSEDDPIRVEVHFDRAIGEARQLSEAFRQCLLTLGVKASDKGAAKKGAVDELRARREREGRRATSDASANA